MENGQPPPPPSNIFVILKPSLRIGSYHLKINFRTICEQMADLYYVDVDVQQILIYVPLNVWSHWTLMSPVKKGQIGIDFPKKQLSKITCNHAEKKRMEKIKWLGDLRNQTCTEYLNI